MKHVEYTKQERLLTCENVSLEYGNKKVLSNVNFTIDNIVRPNMSQGQIIALNGRSGCGKSTLLSMIAGYTQPTTGTIKIGVEQVPTHIGAVGVVPQNYPLFGHRTVFTNLSLALGNISAGEKLSLIEEYATNFELMPHLHKYPCDLSGGQRQRVSIIQQIFAGNKFILLDEPFSGLDSIMKDKVVNLLIKVSELHELNTLIIVSHDIESSCAISDTVYILANPDKNDPEKKNNPSTIVKTYDFLAEGLAYNPSIKEEPRFREIIAEIRTLM